MHHPKKERTLVILKPDAVQRSLIGEIIRRLERTGLKLIALKMAIAKEEQLWKHYNKDDAWYIKKGEGIIENRKKIGLTIDKEPIEYGKNIIGAIIKYFTSSPVVMMVWEGNQAVGIVKKLVGVTEPSVSGVGTIRGDFTLDSYHMSDFDGTRSIRNLIHCTDNTVEYENEWPVWFREDEIIEYKLVHEKILYDVEIDGLI